MNFGIVTQRRLSSLRCVWRSTKATPAVLPRVTFLHVSGTLWPFSDKRARVACRTRARIFVEQTAPCSRGSETSCNTAQGVFTGAIPTFALQ